MNTLSLSKAEQRQLKRLTADNESTIEADRRFFERFFWRSDRIRRASQAELAMNVLLDTKWEHLPDDAAAFVAVKQIAPGVRMRVFMWGAPGNDTDVSEDKARELYERFSASPEAKRAERQMEEAFGRGRQ